MTVVTGTCAEFNRNPSAGWFMTEHVVTAIKHNRVSSTIHMPLWGEKSRSN